MSVLSPDEDDPDQSNLWVSPMDAPLQYPGWRPKDSRLLHRKQLFPIHSLAGRRMGQWRLPLNPIGSSRVEQSEELVPLNYFLMRENVTLVGHRYPVLAVGSNASPAHLHRKLASKGLSATIPIVKVEA